MFTRYSKRTFLLVLAITAIVSAPCRSSTIVISQNTDLLIPSPDDPHSEYGKGWMADAIIDITEHILIDDLDVAVSLTHGAFYDLEITLESPAGTTITLNQSLNAAFWIKEPGGGYSVGGSNRFLFDDEAAIGIDEATMPFDRAFKPAPDFKLSAFDGQDVFGRWRLRIQDVSRDHTGRLERVELIIYSPEPTTVLLFGLGAVIARSLQSHSRRRDLRTRH